VTAIPKLSYEAISPQLRQQLDPRVKRLGYFGEFFQYAAHQPEILSAFLTMTEAFQTALSGRVIEVCALTVSGALKNDYERNQHEQLCLRLGLSKEWVADVNKLSPDTASSLDAIDCAVQRLCLGLVERRGNEINSELNAVVELLSADKAIAILFVVGRYVTHALFVNALMLSPPVKSIFTEAV